MPPVAHRGCPDASATTELVRQVGVLPAESVQTDEQDGALTSANCPGMRGKRYGGMCCGSGPRAANLMAATTDSADSVRTPAGF